MNTDFQLNLFGESKQEPIVDQIDLHSYDTYIVTFSGGKDSMGTLLYLLDEGLPLNKIELWHHDVDGEGETLFDWECTRDYCKQFAAAFGLPIYFSWKEGGFLREMLRNNEPTAPIVFETPDQGLVKIGGKGEPNTRRKFPQIVADLRTRWCSSYLKIDVGSSAIRNQKRFDHSRTLVISGERGEESAARSKYKVFEPDRADSRGKIKGRHVDRFRPILHWLEEDVWKIIERYKIRVHPAYYLGWGRVSCKFCIFGNANQFASAFAVSPSKAETLVELEADFGYTMKRNETLLELVAKGKVYESMNKDLISIATSEIYTLPIFTNNWILPAGAYGESCGPM